MIAVFLDDAGSLFAKRTIYSGFILVPAYAINTRLEFKAKLKRIE
jgi:hypothetical protein